MEETNPQPAAELNETSAPAGDHELTSRVQAILEEIRPYIQSDGGDIELVKIEDQVVYVRLNGACIGCPSSMMTLKGGVETRIREDIPEIEAVEMV